METMSLDGKIALIKRWSGIVFGNNRVAVTQNIGMYYSKDQIRGYYNDLTGKVSEKTLRDSNGVVVNIIVGNKTVYFPISIFQYALGNWDLFIGTGEEKYKENFLTQAKWIIDNQQLDGSWNCFGPIGYKSLTVSSMGQGEAISVVLRAYQITKDNIYLESAKKAATFMILPVERGGTLRIENKDYILEEYADVIGTKKAVLNGWIFSLFGLYDYLKVFNDKEIQDVYEKSIQSLKNLLSRYDMGYWSYYDLTGRIASPAYHELHIALLTTLSNLTDDPFFSDYASRWKTYSVSKTKRLLAICGKAWQKFGEGSEGIIVQ